MKTLYKAGLADEIEERLKRLGPTSKRRWGKMTPAQMAAHCTGVMQLALGEQRPRRLIAGSVVGFLIKGFVVGNDRPLRQGAPAPPFLVMREERDLDTERRRLIEIVHRFAASKPDGCTTHPHPFFGRLTPEQWSNLMYKHLDHHLRQFGV